MTVTAYKQVLVMVDQLRKYAEAVPCSTASANDLCDQMIVVWIDRHGCPILIRRTMAGIRR